MGMPAPDQNKMLSHGSPTPGTDLLIRYFSEEEKMKTRFFGVKDDGLVRSPEMGVSVIPALRLRSG